MKIIIIIAIIFIIYLIIKKNHLSPSTPNASISRDKDTIIAAYFSGRSSQPLTDCQSYYKTLRECYEKFGNAMFSPNARKRFSDYYDIDKYMGITVEEIQKDLEKIARGEPDSNLSSPSADSLISLLASWDRHENLMEIDDLTAFDNAVRKYYTKYGKSMLNLNIIMHFIHTYQLDKILDLSVKDVQESFEIIDSGYELPFETLEIYERKKWRDLKSKYPDISNTKTYLDVLKKFYYKYPKYMFKEDVINEFIKTYQLDTRFYIGYEDIVNDLHAIEEQYKADVAEKGKIIYSYKSYLEVLKQYYLKYGDDMFYLSRIEDFIDEYLLDTRFDIKPSDVIKDLEEIKKTANATPEQTTTPPVQPQSKQKPITTNNATLSKQTLNKQPTTVTVSYTIDYFITFFKDDDFCIDELVGVPEDIKKKLTKYTAIGSWLSDKEALRIIEVFNNDVTFHKIFMEGAFMMSFTIKEKEQYQKLHFSMIFITTPESKERVFSKEIQYRIDDKDYKTMESSLTLRKQGVDDKYNLGNLQDYVERVKIDNLNGRRIKI